MTTENAATIIADAIQEALSLGCNHLEASRYALRTLSDAGYTVKPK
jgi:hypothetical protein